MTWSFPTRAEGAFAGTSLFPFHMLTGDQALSMTGVCRESSESPISKSIADIVNSCRACVGRVCEGEVDMSDVSGNLQELLNCSCICRDDSVCLADPCMLLSALCTLLHCCCADIPRPDTEALQENFLL